MINNKESEFGAEMFVKNLIEKGSDIPCDETFYSFNRNEIPRFYNKELYDRGRQFFFDNIFALFYGKLLGLVTVLATPSALKILMHTKMSGTPMTAYKRYLSTIFHMTVWYESELTPESKFWRSIQIVKLKHNTASKRACLVGLNKGITQKDMALTQFGFMGYVLTRQKMIGLHDLPKENLLGFIHIWRVVGSLMGIEDRFNICRESVEETRSICYALINLVFKPIFKEEEQKDFVGMATNLVEGMWVMNPMIDARMYISLVKNTICDSNDNVNIYQKMHEQVRENLKLRCLLVFYELVMWSLKFKIFKHFYNNIQRLTLWLMRAFPFLAYYKYGYINSQVKFLQENEV